MTSFIEGVITALIAATPAAVVWAVHVFIRQQIRLREQRRRLRQRRMWEAIQEAEIACAYDEWIWRDAR